MVNLRPMVSGWRSFCACLFVVVVVVRTTKLQFVRSNRETFSKTSHCFIDRTSPSHASVVNMFKCARLKDWIGAPLYFPSCKVKLFHKYLRLVAKINKVEALQSCPCSCAAWASSIWLDTELVMWLRRRLEFISWWCHRLVTEPFVV